MQHRQQSQLITSSYTALSQANARQVALVEQCLAMGGRLSQARDGQYYATLPGGQAAPLEVAEAAYWHELAPERVSGYLPGPSVSASSSSNRFRHRKGDK